MTSWLNSAASAIASATSPLASGAQANAATVPYLDFPYGGTTDESLRVRFRLQNVICVISNMSVLCPCVTSTDIEKAQDQTIELEDAKFGAVTWHVSER